MMTDEQQWKQDFTMMQHYREALVDISKGDPDPVQRAFLALDNFMPPESRLWERISELEVCINQMCNNALDLGYCDMADCHNCKTHKVLENKENTK